MGLMTENNNPSVCLNATSYRSLFPAERTREIITRHSTWVLTHLLGIRWRTEVRMESYSTRITCGQSKQSGQEQSHL